MDMSIETKISRSEAETEALGAEIAGQLPAGGIVALYGDLGAGKTVFSRGFARGLGIQEPVSSPTYTIIQEYPLPDGRWFYHLDLYRISNSASALAFGVEEYIEGRDSWSLVEWPERIADIMPRRAWTVTIRHCGENEREITIEKGC